MRHKRFKYLQARALLVCKAMYGMFLANIWPVSEPESESGPAGNTYNSLWCSTTAVVCTINIYAKRSVGHYSSRLLLGPILALNLCTGVCISVLIVQTTPTARYTPPFFVENSKSAIFFESYLSDRVRASFKTRQTVPFVYKTGTHMFHFKHKRKSKRTKKTKQKQQRKKMENGTNPGRVKIARIEATYTYTHAHTHTKLPIEYLLLKYGLRARKLPTHSSAELAATVFNVFLIFINI